MKMKTLAIFSSVSFYKDVLEVERKLKELGFKVIVPPTARKMQKTGNFNVGQHKTWLMNPKDYGRKKYLMEKNFKSVIKADAILVVNNKKKGIEGYIGANVLMEMTIAFHYKKPIYILNKIKDDFWFKEEILGMFPTFLNGDISKVV